MLDLGTLKIGVEVDDAKAKGQLNNLGAEAGKTEGKFSKFKSGLLKVGVGMAAVGAASILVMKKIKNLVDGVAKYGDTVDKNSQKMGISAEAYQKWDYVLQRNGSSINALKTGMKTFSSQIEKGSKAFDTLGVKTKNADGSFRDTTDVLNESMTALAGVKDKTERAALANELFGKRTAQELLPTLNSGADGIKELQDRAEELGFVMSDDTVKACADYEDAMLDVQMATTGLKNNIMSGLVPIMANLASGLADKIGHVSTVIHQEIEKHGAKGILTAIGKLIGEAGNKIVKMAPKLLIAATNLMLSFGKYLAKAIPKGIKAIANLGDKIAEGISKGKTNGLLKSAFNIMKTYFTGLIKAVPKLITSLGKIITSIADNLGKGGSGKMISTGVKLIIDLAVGIVKALPQLLLALAKLAIALIKQIPKLFISLGKGIMKAIIDGIKSSMGVVGKAFATVLKPSKIATKAIDTVKKGWDKVIKQPAKKVYSMAQKKFDEVKNKAKNMWNQWKSNLGQKAHKAYSVAKSGFEAMVNAGRNVYNKWKDIQAQKAKKTFEVLKKGFDTVLSAMKNVWNKWKDILGMNSKKHFSITSSGKVPGKRIGLREVPFDGYTAELHKGEAILTAAETNQYRKWINQQAQMKEQSAQPQVQATIIDYDKLATTMLNALSGMNINTAVNVNGKQIAQATAPFMKSEINAIDRRNNRALGVV